MLLGRLAGGMLDTGQLSQEYPVIPPLMSSRNDDVLVKSTRRIVPD